MNIFGFDVEVYFFVNGRNVLAYAWHYDREKALDHLKKIIIYHGLKGDIEKSIELEEWLKDSLDDVVVAGRKFVLPKFPYRNRKVYEVILNIPKGSVLTYSDVAKLSGVKYVDLLVSLLRNPFQILVPCHRLLTKRGKLMGFYPLGKQVKRRLLELEGVYVDE